MRNPLKTAALRLAAAALPAIALATLAPTPAQAADWDHWMYTDDKEPGARVQFKRDGDVVRLCDIEADGWKAWIKVVPRGGSWGYERGVGGNGNCKTWSAAGGDNLAEGVYYEFTIYLSKSGEGKKYSDTAYWRG